MLLSGCQGKPAARTRLDFCRYVLYRRNMDNLSVIETLGALAQTTRLDVFRLLVRHEPAGIAAGEISRLLDVPHNTLSTHLGILSRAGLIRGTRHSRSIIYRGDLERFRALTLFLVADCCGGDPALAAPLLAGLIPCCAPKETADAG